MAAPEASRPALAAAPLSAPRIEPVASFGHTSEALAKVVRPTSLEALEDVFAHARRTGDPLCLRGAGRSYGDASVLRGAGLVVDLRSFAKVQNFAPERAEITVEPGATIEDLWRIGLPNGLWPKVVSGTMRPTLGGALAMNIHGKNAFRVGTIGRHVRRFRLLCANGEHLEVDREREPRLFRTALGGAGLLGAFTEITLGLQRVQTGWLRVRPIAFNALAPMLDYLEAERERSDYLVGWVDAIGGGRGLVHQAWYADPAELGGRGLAFGAAAQELPSRILGLVPKSWIWPVLWCALNRPGMRAINALKYAAGRLESGRGEFLQPLVAFSFLLDYVPRWDWAYRPGGLVQYQSFVPKAEARRVFEALIHAARAAGMPPYLGVLKRHQAEDFVLSHAVDGFSLALDFQRPSGARRARFLTLMRTMDDIVIDHGGRFYFAKDALLTRRAVERIWPREEFETFRALKERLDPRHLLQSELSRRLFD